MDMNIHILHIQKHKLLHSWILGVTDGSTRQQDTCTYCTYCTRHSKFLTHNSATAPCRAAPPHYRGRRTTLSWDSPRRVIGPTQRPHNTQPSQETDIHATGGIQTHIPSKWTAVDPRLRQRGHWPSQHFKILCAFTPGCRAVLMHITSGPKNQFSLRTVKESLKNRYLKWHK
jgi:hypothetical protein